MSSHFKLYDGMGEVIPFNARYAYPTQANRAWKSVVKIPPKNGSTFRSDQSSAPIRIEFPAQGYLNCANSSLVFDLSLTVPDGWTMARVQNNVQSIFRRIRWVYGSLVGEDVREYNVLVRMLTEATGTNQNGMMDQTGITEGVGGVTTGTDGNLTNTRATFIQVARGTGNVYAVPSQQIDGTAGTPRRYQVQIGLGLFQQNKLLPLKWMASQVTLELELDSFQNACCAKTPADTTSTTGAYFTVENMAYMAELLEFDGSYDAAFLEGLRGEGVPIKFASWDTFTHTPSASTRQTLMIPERNRSLKAIFAVLLPRPRVSNQGGSPFDSHAMLSGGSGAEPIGGVNEWRGHLSNFQWRIGGKYYPAQPVTCGGQLTDGGAEAYFEYAKALNIVGDYRLSTGINPVRWMNRDAASWCTDWDNITGDGRTIFGPSCFVIAADLETSSGSEVSGLNGEEQNDIALMLEYSEPLNPAECTFQIFVYYDALLVLRENNLVELIK